MHLREAASARQPFASDVRESDGFAAAPVIPELGLPNRASADTAWRVVCVIGAFRGVLGADVVTARGLSERSPPCSTSGQ
jgi:hypothetical protein